MKTTSNHSIPRLSVGPIQFFWPKSKVLKFYQMAADSPAEIIYLGETVCSKRRELTPGDWQAIARELAQSGKEVVLSTMGLIESGAEAGALKRQCQDHEFTIEANDLGAVQTLRLEGVPFVAGPGINIYNIRTLNVLIRSGLMRWVLPIELSAPTFCELAAATPASIENEVIVFGRMILGWSARCYTARVEGLSKDQCEFRCLGYPDGLLLRTQEEDPFLSLNGIQTLSALTMNLASDVDEITKMGANVLRVCPQSKGTGDILQMFDELRRDPSLHEKFDSRFEAAMPVGSCDGYWAGLPGKESRGRIGEETGADQTLPR
jgi:collagenase-like PrtC family protease